MKVTKGTQCASRGARKALAFETLCVYRVVLFRFRNGWGSMEDAEVERLLGGPLRVTHKDILGHPRLADARKHYIDRFLQVYAGDPFLVRLFLESGRFFVYEFALVLEAAQDPARPETWLTIGLLKKWMKTLGIASGRHIDHLVARLCEADYMASRVSEEDGRLRILSLTEKARAHDRAWLAAHYAPLAILYPQHDYRPVLKPSKKFQAAHRRISLTFAPLGARLLMSEPDMLLIMNHAAGYLIIAALLQAAMGADQPHAEIRYADAGDRFGVSRTHVRKLLIAAEGRGLVKLHARGGQRVEILPKLWAAHDRGIAGGMYYHDVVFVAAMRAATPARLS
jgi:hypothetical protein